MTEWTRIGWHGEPIDKDKYLKLVNELLPFSLDFHERKLAEANGEIDETSDAAAAK